MFFLSLVKVSVVSGSSHIVFNGCAFVRPRKSCLAWFTRIFDLDGAVLMRGPSSMDPRFCAIE